MRLAVFTAQYFWFDGKHYSTDEAFVRFVTSFCPHFEKIIFCDAVTGHKKTETYVLDPEKTEVCPLPYFSVYSFWRNVIVIFPKIYRIIMDNIQSWDIVWLPGPHPVGLIFAYICCTQRRPFFQLVRANLLQQVKHRHRGMKRVFAMVTVTAMEYVAQRLARKNLTFTVGKELYDIYHRRGGKVHQIGISLISEKDIEDTIARKDFDLHRPVRLLNVGRLDPEKGLIFLIRAVRQIIDEKRLDVVLHIAGKGFTDGEEARLHQEVDRLKLGKHVRFLGHVAHGTQLLTLYREADIFLVPSLTGEGVPQTLFEAMACGTAIVATRVAGIPCVIEDGENGLLIDPASPDQISSAVKRLAEDRELRNHMVKNAFRTARHHTIDIERDKMMISIKTILLKE